MSKIRVYAASLFGIYVAMVLWLTILSRDKLIGNPVIYTPFHSVGSFCEDIRRGGLWSNSLGNIILFIPYGVLLSIVDGCDKPWRNILSGGSFSLIIEIVQLFTSRGCFDPDDVILNTIGNILGYGLYKATKYIITLTKMS